MIQAVIRRADAGDTYEWRGDTGAVIRRADAGDTYEWRADRGGDRMLMVKFTLIQIEILLHWHHVTVCPANNKQDKITKQEKQDNPAV